MSEQVALHNDLAGRIVREIVTPIINSGGSYIDVMVLTESVLVGVALVAIKLGGDNTVLDTMFDRARERLAEIRLKDIQPAGRA